MPPDDTVLQPRIIVGTFGGLERLGLVGLFVGPVIMVAMLLIWRQWREAPPPAGASCPP